MRESQYVKESGELYLEGYSGKLKNIPVCLILPLNCR